MFANCMVAPPRDDIQLNASPVAPGWLSVAKPLSEGCRRVTISKLAPKPPVAMMTAFAFNV